MEIKIEEQIGITLKTIRILLDLRRVIILMGIIATIDQVNFQVRYNLLQLKTGEKE